MTDQGPLVSAASAALVSAASALVSPEVGELCSCALRDTSFAPSRTTVAGVLAALAAPVSKGRPAATTATATAPPTSQRMRVMGWLLSRPSAEGSASAVTSPPPRREVRRRLRRRLRGGKCVGGYGLRVTRVA